MKMVKVFQHGVEIGFLPFNAYDELRKAALADKRLSVLQAIIGVITFFRFLFSVAKTAIFFTAGLILYLFLFENQGLMSDLGTMESARIASFILYFFWGFIVVALTIHLIPFMVYPAKFFKSLGFYNVKEEKISEKLRVLLDSPATGSVYVKIVDEQ
ncbi:TPA: hypothetical protein ACQFHA_003880 [Escherichia coli]